MEHDILVKCMKRYEVEGRQAVKTFGFLTSITKTKAKKIQCPRCGVELEIGFTPKFKLTKRRKADLRLFAIGILVAVIIAVLGYYGIISADTSGVFGRLMQRSAAFAVLFSGVAIVVLFFLILITNFRDVVYIDEVNSPTVWHPLSKTKIVHEAKEVSGGLLTSSSLDLAEVGDARAVELLCKRASNTFAPKEREDAVTALGQNLDLKTLEQTDYNKIVEVLTGAVNDYWQTVRCAAAKSLGNIGGDKAIEALCEALKDKKTEVRCEAAKSLGNIGGDKAIEALCEALKDKKTKVRCEAAKSLGNIGGDKALGKTDRDKASEALCETMKDKDWLVRVEIVKALAMVGGVKALEAIRGASKDKSWMVRDEANEVLGKGR